MFSFQFSIHPAETLQLARAFAGQIVVFMYFLLSFFKIHQTYCLFITELNVAHYLTCSAAEYGESKSTCKYHF